MSLIERLTLAIQVFKHGLPPQPRPPEPEPRYMFLDRDVKPGVVYVLQRPGSYGPTNEDNAPVFLSCAEAFEALPLFPKACTVSRVAGLLSVDGEYFFFRETCYTHRARIARNT